MVVTHSTLVYLVYLIPYKLWIVVTNSSSNVILETHWLNSQINAVFREILFYGTFIGKSIGKSGEIINKSGKHG